MDKLTVVMQGQITQWTKPFIEKYLQYDFIDKLIVSTWDDEQFDFDCPRVDIVYSQKPSNYGLGNRNLQIVSSRNGVFNVETEFCVKIRTDMFLPEMPRMQVFVKENWRKDRLSVLGMYDKLPLHPRDHVFWGATTDLETLFNIPLDEKTGTYREWTDLRSETYIGMHYYAKKDEKACRFAWNPYLYLTDDAPYKGEALEYAESVKGKYFVPFPKVQIEWPKHYPAGYYPWHLTKEIYGEYTFEDLNV